MIPRLFFVGFSISVSVGFGEAADPPDFHQTLLAFVESRNKIVSLDFEYTYSQGKFGRPHWVLELNGRYAYDSRVDSSYHRFCVLENVSQEDESAKDLKVGEQWVQKRLAKDPSLIAWQAGAVCDGVGIVVSAPKSRVPVLEPFVADRWHKERIRYPFDHRVLGWALPHDFSVNSEMESIVPNYLEYKNVSAKWIDEEKGIVQYKMHDMEMTFDLQRSGLVRTHLFPMLVRDRATGKMNTIDGSRCSIAVVKVNDVWVPEKMLLRSADFVESVRIKWKTVNELIPPELFDLKRFENEIGSELRVNVPEVPATK
jgi:hypothetical protein